MKPRITLITLGVDDLERSLRFYRDGLGLATDGIIGTEFEYGAVVFFELKSGFRLALWPRRSIAHDTGLARGVKSPTEFTLAHNVSSANEVDAVMNEAEKAGATRVFFSAEDRAQPSPCFWRVACMRLSMEETSSPQTTSGRSPKVSWNTV